PLTDGVVIFHPDSSRGNMSRREARGRIDPQGNYALTADAGGGVLAGAYRGSVVATRKNSKNEDALPTWGSARRSGDPRTPGLTAEVRPDAARGQYALKVGS